MVLLSTQTEKDELKERIAKLMASGCFFEAEKMYQAMPLFHISIYNKVKAEYVSDYARDITLTLEQILKSFNFDEADYVFAQNDDILDRKQYNSLRTKYLGKQLKANLIRLLSEDNYFEAEKLFLLNKNLITSEKYEGLKSQFNQKIMDKILPEIQQRLKAFQFDEADKIFQEWRHAFNAGYYERLRQKYVVEQAEEDLALQFKQHRFKEAATQYTDKYMNTLSMPAYNKLRNQYMDGWRDEIENEIKNKLNAFDFAGAEEIYQSNWQNFSGLRLFYDQVVREYKIKWINVNVENLLREGRFAECDQFYRQSRLYLSKETYETLKARRIKEYFRGIEDNLNDEQCKAISKVAKNNIITARAGSGKTTTIACKSLHIILNENVPTDQIALVAFNRKAKEEMKERLEHKYKLKDLPLVLTFHGLAYSIVRPAQTILFDEEGYSANKKLSQFIQQIIRETWDENFKEDLYTYFRKEVEELEEQDVGLSGEDYLIFRRNQTH